MGKQQDSLLRIAAEQLGVTEWPASSNKVLYNTWYYGRQVSGSAYPWCMAFVQWCFNQNGTPLPFKTASCSALLNWYKKNQPKQIVTTPQKGDVVIYNFSHTGIIESSSTNTITAIEGNTTSNNNGSQSNGGGVFRRTRNKSTVTAFIRPIMKEEEKPMTGKEILAALTDEQAYELLMKAQTYAGKLPEPSWSVEEGAWEKAEKAGIVAGRPEGLLKRDEFIAVMDRNGLIKEGGNK